MAIIIRLLCAAINLNPVQLVYRGIQQIILQLHCCHETRVRLRFRKKSFATKSGYRLSANKILRV